MPANLRVHPWEDVELGNVASITLGGTPSTEVKSFWGGDVPWMSSGEVNKRHVFDADGRITRSGLMSSNATLVDPPAVAIGLAGQGKTRGTVAMVHTQLCTNQSIALIKGNNGRLDTTYLFHNFESRYEELRSRSAGGGRAGLSRDILMKVPVPLPDVAEQRRIAAVLDLVDSAIAKTDAVIAKLRSIRAGLLHDLLTRGLDANGQLRDPLRHPEQFKPSPLGLIPKEWEMSELLAVSEITSGITLGRQLDKAGSILVPYLRVANLQDGYIDLSEVKTTRILPGEEARFLLAPGDVLLTEGGDIDKLGRGAVWKGEIVPCAYQNHIFRVRVNRQILMPEFLGAFLQTSAAKRYFLMHAKRTTSVASVNQTELGRFPVPIPSPEEQGRIVASLDQQAGIMNREIAARNKLSALKSGLMSDLLSGRVRVPE